ncbi:LamG domain-containing protein [Streptomyces roseoviridis]|uniref:LamG-like jellyroll fold domain-containing protein n=1 Tax=Streptomyces roseoviridis TaxID=67361 RepID=A0ABV5QNG4_9ACTN
MALTAAWALLVSAVPMLTGAPAVADEASAAALTETERALREAADTGSRVEVVGERSERETVFANPDGATFTMEKSIVPVRVDTGEGWVQPDATLVRREDGSIGPKAAAVDLSISGGGPGAGLVTIGEAGQSVSMGWPGKLPTPRLEGERAVYEDVLPDVNLILTATLEGFRQVLEVRTPEAAALPELKAITYDIKADGLRLREGALGSVEALDGNGQVVFRSPTAQMWNSAGEDDAAPADAGLSTRSAGLRALDTASAEDVPAQQETSEPVAPPQEGDPLAGPGAGDEAAVMAVELAKDSLTVVPDADLIAATGAEDFPLYIDPSVELNESERTVLSSDGDVFYNFSGGDNGMSVGKCGSAVINGVSYYCGSGYVNRMYFEFTPEKLRGKHILDATFAVTETWSFSCDSRMVDLQRTDPISSSSKWPGPAVRDHLGDRDVSAGRGTACSPSQPRAVIEFNDNPAETDENLTPAVRALADGKLSVLTLKLSAHDETDTVAWKRFDDDAVIRVKYMSKPAPPAEYGFASSSAPTCSKLATSPNTVTDPTPILMATPRTQSGGETGAMLRVYYDIDGQKPGETTWFDAPPPTDSLAPTTGHLSYSTTARDFPSQAKEWNNPLAEDGTLYRYAAYTYSYADTSYTAPLGSGNSPYCYFRVDSKGPKPPVVTSSSVYKQCVQGGACEPSGGPNQTGSFTFGSATGETNTHYQYRLDDAPWSSWTAMAGSFTVNVTPGLSGSRMLYVRVKDAQGRVGEEAVKFLVKEGPGPVGRWDFNESSGPAVDRSTSNTALQNNLDLTATGTGRNDRGRRGELTAADASKSPDKALALTSASHGAASTTKQVVETQASYTLTAWARLDTAVSGVATVLGQDGAYHSAFYLSYCGDVKTWCVRLPDKDGGGASFSAHRVAALNPPQPKAWTHLGVVVDSGERKIHFYVNGVLQGSDSLTTALWASTGGLQVGRAKYMGSYVDYFPGEIDEAAIWQDKLSAEAMAIEASLKDTRNWAYAELVAQYNPQGASGSSLPDGSGYDNRLTMSSSGSLNGEDIFLDGVDDSATAARPVVDDTGSFSVATSVNVEAGKLSALPTGSRLQVLGQQSGTGSSWSLWFEKTGTIQVPLRDSSGQEVIGANGEFVMKDVPVGRWHFGRLTADGTGASARTTTAQAIDGEVRLTGVFDAEKRTVTLYVNGGQAAAGVGYTAVVGSDFTVGKGWTGSYLPGRISDIRLWAGALTDEAQVEAVVGH